MMSALANEDSLPMSHCIQSDSKIDDLLTLAKEKTEVFNDNFR